MDEIKAMQQLSKIVGALSEKDRAFVVRWFVDKYAGQSPVPAVAVPSAVETSPALYASPVKR
jgi:hypothetical protein